MQNYNALMSALEPFAKTARGIPENWPDHGILTFRDEERHDIIDTDPAGNTYRVTHERYLNYLTPTEDDDQQDTMPTIGDWRRLAKGLYLPIDEEPKSMCEATCVINELTRLKRDVAEVIDNQYTAMGFEQRIQLCIDQLKAANEGESWHDLKLRFVPSTQP